jgi:bacterioferritin-associated ferredoxin
MYVCLCQAVTSATVTQVIEDGASTVEDVGARTEAGTVCGRCTKTIEKLLAGERRGDKGRPGTRKERSWRRG